MVGWFSVRVGVAVAMGVDVFWLHLAWQLELERAWELGRLYHDITIRGSVFGAAPESEQYV